MVVSISDIICFLLIVFFIFLWVDSIGDREREEYLERYRLLKKQLNKK